MRALYAAEGVSKKEADDLLLKSVVDYQNDSGEVVPIDEVVTEIDGEASEKDYFGTVADEAYSEPCDIIASAASSYEEYDTAVEEWKRSREAKKLIDLFPTIARNAIVYGDPNEDKAAKIEELARELADRMRETYSDDDGEDDKSDGFSKAISERDDVSESDKKRSIAEYGKVKYADAKNKKYPIDTVAHIRAAWNYINMPRNASKYSAAEVKQIKNHIIAAWKSKIDKKGPPSQKEIRGDIGLMAEHVAYYIKSIAGLDNEEAEPDIMFWKDKDTDRTMWIARYSNNFIDSDNPPDIISESSHRRFVENVDKGVYPLPELWLWHQKEWKIGQAVWCAYDDSGFSVAAGYISPECEQVVKEIASLPTPALSHGMPLSSIVRDKDDPRVILEHQTVEISVLPLWAAANKTGNSFELIEGGDMLPKDKRKALIENWGISADKLDILEKLNQEAADKAAADGLEQKEDSQVGEATDVNEPEARHEQTETSEQQAESGETEAEEVQETKELTREEVAEAIVAVFEPHIEATTALKERVEELTALVKELQNKVAGQEQKVEKSNQTLYEMLFRTTPTASLAALSTRGVAGSDSAKVKEGEKFSSPKEEKSAEQVTGIQFIDAMLGNK